MVLVWSCVPRAPALASAGARLCRLQQTRGIGQIEIAAVESHAAQLTAADYAPRTIRNHLGAISQFCGFLLGRGLLTVNPAVAVRFRKPDDLPAFCTAIIDALSE